ncbi:hypothetical protein AB0918_32560 [Streptomyces sp. NPDC006864]|uniref:8-oxoguanine DNA glycosylase OGG fold protein n=1 Tax=Streptomyces sp. NPDC006864 TaxID=3154780 RepID=UPI0034548A8B
MLAQAVALLATYGAVAGYRRLSVSIAGLDAVFFTKVLYFASGAVVGAPGPLAFILDQSIARGLRAYRPRLEEEIGLRNPRSSRPGHRATAGAYAATACT